jgi:hypothetical protein
MSNNSLTDVAYETIGRIERQKRRLTLLITGLILPAILCSAASAYLFIVYSHQKGGLSDINIVLIGLLALLCAALLGIAINKLTKLNKLNKNLGKLEDFEETIRREVLKYQVD